MKKLVIYGLSPNNGGIESYIYSIVFQLKNNYEVVFLILGEERPCYFDELSKIGCRFVFLPSRKKGFISNKKALIEFFENEKPDIMHYNISSLSYYLPCSIAAQYNCKVIVHAHNSARSGSRISTFLHRVHRFTFPRKKFSLVAVSEDSARWVFGDSVYATVLDNGVNVDRFRYSPTKRNNCRNNLGISDDEYLIIHVGAFKFQKNHKFLIDIFEHYIQFFNRKSKLILIGSGNLEKEIRKKVQDRGLSDYVLFLGSKNNVDEYLCAGDVFVFPSVTEGFPISLIEAEASGIKCIVSDIIMGKAIIPDICDKHSLEDSLDTWCKSFVKNEENVRQKSYEHILDLNLDVSSVTNKLINIYEN